MGFVVKNNKMRTRLITIALVVWNIAIPCQASENDVMTLSLQEVIRMAQESSPNAVRARNEFESAY